MFIPDGGATAGGGSSMLKSIRRSVDKKPRAAADLNLKESCSSVSSITSNNSPSSKFKINNKSAHMLAIRPSESELPHYYGRTNPDFDDEESDWISVNEFEIERSTENEIRVYEDFALGPAPSLNEVQTAITALKEAFHPDMINSHSEYIRDKFGYNLTRDVTSPTSLTNSVYSDDSDLGWKEPSMLPLSNFQPDGYDIVREAFQVLRDEPIVQRMVTSMGTDEEMWKCAQNNKFVREMRKLICPDTSQDTDQDSTSESSDEKNFVSWILDNTKGKAMEIFELLTNFVNNFFKLPQDENPTGVDVAGDRFEKMVRISYKLTIVVLLVVVLNRARGCNA